MPATISQKLNIAKSRQPAVEVDSFCVQHELRLPPLELNASSAHALGACVPVHDNTLAISQSLIYRFTEGL